MARGERPFLFCRYKIRSEEESLGATAQLKLFEDIQGQAVSHRSREGIVADTLLMRPRKITVEGFTVLTWSVGQQQTARMKADYDPVADEIRMVERNDEGLRFVDFVALPDLGVLAVDDRLNDIHFGGKQGISRLKSVIRSEEGLDADIIYEATADEVQNALKSWSLTNFNFTIRPNNPRPVSRLAEELSEQMKADGIGRLSARAVPKSDDTMQMGDSGLIQAVADLVDAGYGQLALAGRTEDGLRAEIKKPKYSADRQQNEAASEKPRELRVWVEVDANTTDDDVVIIAAEALIKFYS